MTAAPTGEPKDRTLRALTVAIAGSLASVLPVFLTAALAVRMGRDLAIPAEQVVAAGSTLFLWSAVLSIPCGRIIDRVGWPKSIRLSLLCSAASLVCVGLVASSLTTLCAAAAIGGLANALAVPSGNAVLLAHAAPHRRGVVYGLKQSAIPTANLFAGATLSVAGSGHGWRASFILTGGVTCVLALALPLPAPAGTKRVIARPGRAGTIGRHLTTLAVAGCVGSACASGAATFIAASAIKGGMTETAAGLLLALASCTGIAVRVAAGALVDHRGHGQSALSWLMLCGAVGMLALALPSSTAIVVGSLVALGAGWGWQGLLQHAIAVTYPDRVGQATGVVQAGLAAGAAAGPMGFAFVASGLSYPIAWVTTAGVAALAAVMLYRLAWPAQGASSAG